MGGADDLLAGALGGGVVAIMVWYWDWCAGLTSQYIILPVIFRIKDFAANQRAHLCVIINNLQPLSLFCLIIVECDDIERGTSKILLTQIEIVSLDINKVILILQPSFYLLKPILLPR